MDPFLQEYLERLGARLDAYTNAARSLADKLNALDVSWATSSPAVVHNPPSATTSPESTTNASAPVPDVSGSTTKAQEIPTVAHDAAPVCITMVPVTCSTECSTQVDTIDSVDEVHDAATTVHLEPTVDPVHQAVEQLAPVQATASIGTNTPSCAEVVSPVTTTTDVDPNAGMQELDALSGDTATQLMSKADHDVALIIRSDPALPVLTMCSTDGLLQDGEWLKPVRLVDMSKTSCLPPIQQGIGQQPWPPPVRVRTRYIRNLFRPKPWPSFKFHSDTSYQEEPCTGIHCPHEFNFGLGRKLYRDVVFPPVSCYEVISVEEHSSCLSVAQLQSRRPPNQAPPDANASNELAFLNVDISASLSVDAWFSLLRKCIRKLTVCCVIFCVQSSYELCAQDIQLKLGFSQKNVQLKLQYFACDCRAMMTRCLVLLSPADIDYELWRRPNQTENCGVLLKFRILHIFLAPSVNLQPWPSCRLSPISLASISEQWIFNYDEHAVVSIIPWHEKLHRAMNTRRMSVNWSFLSRREIKFRSEANYLEELCSIWSDCHHTAIIYLREEGIMERKIPTVQAPYKGVGMQATRRLCVPRPPAKPPEDYDKCILLFIRMRTITTTSSPSCVLTTLKPLFEMLHLPLQGNYGALSDSSRCPMHSQLGSFFLLKWYLQITFISLTAPRGQCNSEHFQPWITSTKVLYFTDFATRSRYMSQLHFQACHSSSRTVTRETSSLGTLHTHASCMAYLNLINITLRVFRINTWDAGDLQKSVQSYISYMVQQLVSVEYLTYGLAHWEIYLEKFALLWKMKKHGSNNSVVTVTSSFRQSSDICSVQNVLLLTWVDYLEACSVLAHLNLDIHWCKGTSVEPSALDVYQAGHRSYELHSDYHLFYAIELLGPHWGIYQLVTPWDPGRIALWLLLKWT
ncbi:hypothetical protein VPH35_096537 [Triticum aestivum]